MIDLLSDAEENSVSEIYGRSAAFEAETPPEPSWLVPIKINNASIYKAQISPQNPEAALCQTTRRTQERRERAVNECVGEVGVRKRNVCQCISTAVLCDAVAFNFLTSQDCILCFIKLLVYPGVFPLYLNFNVLN